MIVHGYTFRGSEPKPFRHNEVSSYEHTPHGLLVIENKNITHNYSWRFLIEWHVIR